MPVYKDRNYRSWTRKNKKHPLHPSLYAFVNGNKQLDKLLNVELPAVEKLDVKSDNKSVKDIILPRLESYFKDDVSTKIVNFYKIFSKRLEKLESAMNTIKDKYGKTN